MKNTSQKNKLFLLILLFATFYQTAITQTFNQDSVLQLIEGVDSFEEKFQIIKDAEKDVTKQDSTGKQAIMKMYFDLSDASSDPFYRACGKLTEGLNYSNNFLLQESIIAFDETMNILKPQIEQIKEGNFTDSTRLHLVVKCQIAKSYSLMAMKHSEAATAILESSLTTAKAIKDDKLQVKIYCLLGYQYIFALENREQGYNYLLEGLKVAESGPLEASDLSIYIFLFEHHFTGDNDFKKCHYFLDKVLDKTALHPGDYDYEDKESAALQRKLRLILSNKEIGEAEKYLPRYEALARKHKDYNALATVYIQMSRANSFHQNIEDAYAYLQKVYSLENVMNVGYIRERTLQAEADYDMCSNNKEKSLISINNLLEEYKSTNDNRNYYLNLGRRAGLHRNMKNYKAAYEDLNAYKGYQDSLMNQELAIAQSEALIEYETEKKEKEIIELKNKELLKDISIQKQQNLLFGSIGGISLLGILAFSFFRNARKEKMNNSILEEKSKIIQLKNAQNEVLLKEIHHRVKNNLQTISSLLSLQSNTIKDPTALDAVQESRNRVGSMALIHQKLYQGENLAAIEMRDYFETIGRAVLKSFGGKAKGVELEVNMPEIELDVDTAIPIGLITNELITNSLKYAFQEKESGRISISMTKEKDNLIQLQIADDGINQSTGISEGGTGFGTMLVKLLTTQLKGQLKQTTEEGTSTIIQFPLNMKVA